MTSIPHDLSRSGNCAANAGLDIRSGEMSSTSIRPPRTSASTEPHSSTLVELTVAALSPARPAAVIWSRIRASSGETTSVGPAPASRRAAVAAQ